MKTIEQILNEIREYQYGDKENTIDQAQALSFKINLLQVIVEIFYTHVYYMAEPQKFVSFENDIKLIERQKKAYGESFDSLNAKNCTSYNEKRILLDNVWHCEAFVLSKYDGINREFVKMELLEVKEYFTKKYGALLDLENNNIRLYSESPKKLHDEIIDSIKKGIDPQGKKIIGWDFKQETGVGSGVIVCTENNLDKTYNLLLNVHKTNHLLLITSHFINVDVAKQTYPVSERQELLLRFGDLWKTQLTSIA